MVMVVLLWIVVEMLLQIMVEVWTLRCVLNVRSPSQMLIQWTGGGWIGNNEVCKEGRMGQVLETNEAAVLVWIVV